VRAISQPTAPQPQEILSFPDDLEVVIATIECRLLESLSPQQFAMVQHLVEANKLLTEAELTLGRDILAAAPERKSA
jgi:hypothetical protein